MLLRFYTRFLFRYPKWLLAMLVLFLAFAGYYSTKLEIDASSNTLLLEGDKDLAFTRQISKRYGGSNFLLVAFTPKQSLLDTKTLQTIKSLSDELRKLPEVTSITSIRTVPLLLSSGGGLSGLSEGIDTLATVKNPDKEKIKEEFLTNPLYKDGLVSKDFQTTAIMVHLKDDPRHRELVERRNGLQERLENGANGEVSEELAKVEQELKIHRDKRREIDSRNIEQVRAILSAYEDEGQLFLGGVNMIANDIIGFIKDDLRIYGSILALLLVTILWLVFRQWQWVAMPVVICIAAVIAATGSLGFFGWEVTVISSNFISLQLIITISLVLHLIVRYRELQRRYPGADKHKLILVATLSKIKPSFFAIITTVAGFGSLIFSKIQPVIGLGLMMSVAITLSLILVFLLFPALLVLGRKIPPPHAAAAKREVMTKVAAQAQKRKHMIFAVSIAALVFSASGASRLIVENSFIGYFKESTEIYQGMEIIDEKLGGTTPLDVIVRFKEAPKPEPKPAQDDFFASFESEFARESQSEEYWFTQQRMKAIEKIHDYLTSIDALGDVQSLGTLLKVGRKLNGGKDLDSFQLALMYKELPKEYKKTILDPYISIEHNEVRFAIRVIDSTEGLRRNALLKRIKTDLEQMELEAVQSVRLSNLMVLYNNMLQSLFHSQILTLGLVALVLFTMFMVLFRSFTLSFIALSINIVPITVVFGIMGWAGIPLDIMTITIAAISIGIGVDDTIHYIDRYRIEYKKDGDYLGAMYRSHESVGYAMYYTTLTVMVGFSILLFSNFIPTIYFGLLTVLVMALLLSSALLLLPRMLLSMRPAL